MAKVIGVCNQKGGVGKTTTVIAMGRALVDKGYKVLLVDVDDSGNPSLTKVLGVEEKNNLLDMMMQTCMNRDISSEIPGYIKKHKEGMDIICGDKDLAGITHYINGMEDEEKKRTILKNLIRAVNEQYDYDYILLDAAPSLNMMAINLLAASDEVIIVSQPQDAAEEGIINLLQTILKIKKNINRALIVKGLLITMVDARTNYNRDKSAKMTNDYTSVGIKVFKTQIPRAIVAESCTEAKESVIEYKPDSKPAVAYRAFVDEYLGE